MLGGARPRPRGMELLPSPLHLKELSWTLGVLVSLVLPELEVVHRDVHTSQHPKAAGLFFLVLLVLFTRFPLAPVLSSSCPRLLVVVLLTGCRASRALAGRRRVRGEG